MAAPESKLFRCYKFLAFTTFNTIIFILVLNLVLGIFFMVRDSRRKPHTRVSSYRLDYADLDAYTRISSSDANKYLDEQEYMGNIGFEYEPWVQFRHTEVHGAFLNTDSHGFRKSKEPQKREGTPLKVYVFGGSTTFGYGVPDDYTIPSYIQTIMEQRYPDRPVLVRNFGQGYYYSSQEMFLLLTLIKDGDIPDCVVFIDGINDTPQLGQRCDEPLFTPTVRELWNSKRGVSAQTANTQRGPSRIPMIRFANSLLEWMSPEKITQPSSDAASQGRRKLHSDEGFTPEEIRGMAEYVVARYSRNMDIVRTLCKENAIECLFVWQPHPGYKYDRSLHKKFPFKGEVPTYLKMVYSQMETYKAEDYLFLGSLLEKATSKVYVDDVHYNETVNEAIAQQICDRLKANKKVKTDKPGADNALAARLP
jgi:hypothetical protein